MLNNEDSYTYLGLLFNYNGNFCQGCKKLVYQAQKALYDLYISKNIKAKQKPYYITAQEVLKENNYIPDNIYSHRSLFGLLYFFIWPLFYLFFSDLQLLITLLASSNSSVFLLFTVFDYPFGIFKLFGLSSIYSFWLPFWYLQTLLSVLLFKTSDYPFGIFKVFFVSFNSNTTSAANGT